MAGMKDIPVIVRTPADQVANAAAFYAACIYSLADLESYIEEAVGTADVASVLDSCLPGVKRLVRHIFKERPLGPWENDGPFRIALREWVNRT